MPFPDRVLVTGADGFIGSHLVERLVALGRPVRALALYNSFGSWGWLDKSSAASKGDLDVVLGDVRDAECVRAAMRDCGAVLHLAALIGIPYSYQAPRSYVDTNVVGTLNVVQAARDLGIAKVIHTSTSEVYGTPQTVPIAETHPLQGQSPYSASKIAADQIALSYFLSFATPVTVIRPFNTYGPRQSTRAVIPTIIAQLAKGARTIRLGATQPTRDFNYVADTVAGFIAALDATGTEGEVINLGSGFEISIGATAQLIGSLMNKPFEIQTEAARLRPAASEVERLLADNSKAARLLGWKPGRAGKAGLEEGLAQTIAWFTRPENLAAYPRTGYAV